jgi:hypothetical protein
VISAGSDAAWRAAGEREHQCLSAAHRGRGKGPIAGPGFIAQAMTARSWHGPAWKCGRWRFLAPGEQSHAMGWEKRSRLGNPTARIARAWPDEAKAAFRAAWQRRP